MQLIKVIFYEIYKSSGIDKEKVAESAKKK